jgi:hypothetical protein
MSRIHILVRWWPLSLLQRCTSSGHECTIDLCSRSAREGASLAREASTAPYPGEARRPRHSVLDSSCCRRPDWKPEGVELPTLSLEPPKCATGSGDVATWENTWDSMASGGIHTFRKYSNRTNMEPKSLSRLPPPSGCNSRAITSAHTLDCRPTSA